MKITNLINEIQNDDIMSYRTLINHVNDSPLSSTYKKPGAEKYSLPTND